MAERVPPEVQQQIVKLQQLQAQLNQILMEKSVLQQELREIERALSVLKDLPPDVEIYRATGHLLIKVKKEDAEKELNERKELIELRMKTLDKQESLIRQQLAEVQSKVSQYMASMYKSAQGAS